MRYVRTALCSFLIAFASVPASAQSNHSIDPATDIIIGADDAQHELVIYFGPNCGKCRQTHVMAYETIRRDYVDTGRLRLIYRDPNGLIAAPSQVPQFQVLNSMNVLLSQNLACHHLTHGSEHAAQMIDRQFRFLEAAFPRGMPPMEQEDARGITAHMVREGIIVPEEYDACRAQDVARQIHELMVQHRQTLREVTGAESTISLPAYFLNGELVAIDSETELPLILDALAREIGE
ncbi:MAG: thioredoxin domain-containing protein [Paracoccaceae bacterium]